MTCEDVCYAVMLIIFEGLSGEETLDRVIDLIAQAEFGDNGASLKQIESLLAEAAKIGDKQ